MQPARTVPAAPSRTAIEGKLKLPAATPILYRAEGAASQAAKNARRKRKPIVVDLFCGAGSLSAGAYDALTELGYAPPQFIAVNHWDIATQTYAKNHPGARVICSTLEAAHPMQIVTEGYVDLLMAGIDCTFHSRARGGKPVTDQQRMSGWHVVQWCTELRVKRLLIENVPEYLRWGPVDTRTKRPIKSREGEYFRAWWAALEACGMRLEKRVINCADNGDATTRERLFVIGRSDRKKLYFPIPTHAKLPDMFGAEKWRPARECIDWGIKGQSIFTRKKPLAPKTLSRIAAGIIKFKWPEPFLVVLKQHCDARGLDIPFPTIHAAGTHLGLVEPFVVGNRENNTGKPIDGPMPGATTATGGGIAVVQPLIMNGRKNNKAKPVSADPIPTLDTKGGVWLAEPFIATVAHGNDPRERDPNSRRCNSLDDPMQAQHAGGGKFALVEPFILNRHGDNGGHCRASSLDVPTPTATAAGGGYVVEPFILSPHNSGAPRSSEEPFSAFTLGGSGNVDHPGCARHAVVEPFVLSQASGGAPRATEEPMPTVPGGGAHALIAPYYGSGSGKTCSSSNEPLPAATTKARFGIVVPVTHNDGSNRARDVETDPLPTLTTANRGELAFITASFGERPTQAPRTHSTENPAPTICAQGRINLVEPGAQFDILFRMLEPHELAAAMSISTVEKPYHFVGNKTEVVRQIGQAVPRRTGRAIAMALMAE